MNLGHEIVSSVLREGTLRPYLAAGLTTSWLHDNHNGAPVIFADDLDFQAYDYLLNHQIKHKKVPDEELFRFEFPARTYKLSKSETTPDELIELVVREIRRLIAAEAANDIAVLHDDGDIDGAVERIQSAANQIRVGINNPGNTSEEGSDEFDVEALLSQEMTMGVPLGIKSIDDQYYGFQPGQLITLLGRQKATKTTSLLYSSVKAWLDGYSVLFYSIEMDQDEIRNLLYAIGAGVNPELLRRGKLRSSDKQKVRDFYKKMNADYGDVRYLISHRGAMTSLDEIAVDFDKFTPHVIYIDGVYFMKDRRTGESAATDWTANENLAVELKTFAMESGIPVVVTTQVQEKQHNKKSKTIDGGTMMGGTGLLRSSNLVLGYNKDPDQRPVTINDSRNRHGHIDTVRIQWDFETMTPTVLEEDDESEDY